MGRVIAALEPILHRRDSGTDQDVRDSDGALDAPANMDAAGDGAPDAAANVSKDTAGGDTNPEDAGGPAD
jgi:hypothetical protein